MNTESSDRSLKVLHVALASLVGTLLVASWISGTWSKRGFGDTRCRVLLSYSPSSQAFSIWSVIYALTVLNVTVQIVGELDEKDLYSSNVVNLLHAAAWGLAAIWLPLFKQSNASPLAYVLSGIVLVLMAGVSYAAAVVSAEEWSQDNAEIRRWTLAAPVSLLAGWTCTAASLNVGIAYMANVHPESRQCAATRYPRNYWLFSHLFRREAEDDETTRLDAVRNDEQSVVPLVLAAILVSLALLRLDPILPVPLIWGVLFMRYTHLNFFALIVCVIGVAAAFVRVYV